MTTTRTPERIEFLSGLLVTAIENYGYGWFTVDEYEIPEGNEAAWFAVITSEDEGETFRVDLDTMAKGLGVIRRAVLKATPTEVRGAGEPWEFTTGGEEVLHNAVTGERLYMSEGTRKNIMLADRTNHEDGDLDVVDALAVLECALFGKVVYA